METPERRKITMERMAKDLVRSGEPITCDSDAMAVLRQLGYPMVDVAILAPEARMIAYQEIVAAEMGKS